MTTANVERLHGNITSNSTLSRKHSNVNLSATEIIALSQLVFVFLLGTVGNILVIHVFAFKKRSRRKRFESLLLILAVADLLSSLVVPVLYIYGTATHYQQWHFGYYGCKIISSIFPLTITFSQGILVLISFERYKTIINPFAKKISQKFIIIWMLVTMVIALLLVSPFTYSLELVHDKEYAINTCMPPAAQSSILYIYSIGSFLRDFAATAGMIILSSLTAKALKQGQTLCHERNMKKRIENANKARKMLLVVVSVFCVCVLPVDVFQFCVYTLTQLNVKFGQKVYSAMLTTNTFLTILQVTNCATNILIYSRMHKDFTRHLFRFARKSNRFFKDSIVRMTFRNSRSDSTTSLSEEDQSQFFSDNMFVEEMKLCPILL